MPESVRGAVRAGIGICDGAIEFRDTLAIGSAWRYNDAVRPNLGGIPSKGE
jgi:hypothetical protein